ncbi:hypothetical protein KGY79_06375 [Candidatus Bipolaricaulota bacterium]|nr:hypothetical protein [Candidatus Bipolaricaulota bacterium]
MTEKKTEELDIPAVGDYKEDYWEVDLGDKIVKVQKPKDPIADLKDMTKGIEIDSPEEEKAKIHNSMKRSFRVDEEG